MSNIKTNEEENDLWAIARNALREIYDEAEPGLDFDDVLENPEDYQYEWFNEHELAPEREREIVRKYKEKHNMTNRESVQFTLTVITEYGPANPEDDGGE
jgi:hypothetical protein